MNDTNPIELVDDLKLVLERYIATTLPISRRYPQLGARFRDELSNQPLVVGPYVEALPDFEKGATLNSLLLKNGGFLHDSMGAIPTAGRLLHKHQQTALELSALQQKSLLVATGTGSGKTETFLYPIAHDLLTDPDPDKPGVRALLIYPMNALANDQLYYRIAPLFGRYLANHGITFGRYTGQVKANVKRDDEEFRLLSNSKLMAAMGEPSRIPKNWYLTREEMLKNPPKVLITNYAMLEHLLLLPRNEALFRANALRFIVLDEIHTYRGAQATEVAFLLRKLKNRLGIKDSIQVFGTSASLAEGQDANEQLKNFAGGLFGEKVDEVVRGKRIVHHSLQANGKSEFSLSIPEWLAVGKALQAWSQVGEDERDAETWNDQLSIYDITSPNLNVSPGTDLGAHLQEVFCQNTEIRKVAKILDSGGVTDFRVLSKLAFDEASYICTEVERYGALSATIRLGMLARKDDNGFPLLPGRYHLAVNSIEGISVLLSNSDEGWLKLKAAKSHTDADGIYFPLLACRKCGQPFVEAFEESGALSHRRSVDSDGKSKRCVFWLGKPVGHVEDEADEDTEAAEGDVPTEAKVWVDPKTGSIGASEGAIPLYSIATQQDEQDGADYVKKCPACGGIASGAETEVVTKMHPGNEALGSVVTQRVLEALPPSLIDNIDPRPGLGRNLLTFSDNRQDAAFFAPYFERTSSDVALRSAIRNVLKERTSPISAPQLARYIYQYWQANGQLPVLMDSNGAIVSDANDATEILLGRIGAEFCTPGGRRNSVESLGVVSVTYDESKLKPFTRKVSAILPEGLSNDVASVHSLVHVLLEHIRRERALSKFHNVPLRDTFVWGDYYQHRSFDVEAGDQNVVYKWLPTVGKDRHNRRSWYLVEQLGLDKEVAFAFLRQFWEVLVTPAMGILERCNPGYGLNGDLIRFSNGEQQAQFVCKSCGLLQQHSIKSKCTAFRCHGELEELSAEERETRWVKNHYLASYNESNHFTVRAREHTASLSTDLREEVERDFADRKVNVLSCTTTMEMGVDLGDLEAVVNLNVPPSIANYQQRTGRAGRRAQAAPFCVTVAKNSNFDQSVVKKFSEYLGSSPSAPFIHLDNAELFLRHQQSILFSHLLRKKISDMSVNAPSIKHLFGEVFAKEELRQFTEGLMSWLEGADGVNATKEAESLVDLLPVQSRAIGGRGKALSIQFLSVLREFAEEICERYTKYTEKMEEMKESNELSKAAYWQRMRQDFMGQFLVTQLSHRGLIPTYSFPVHSLTLEVIGDNSRNSFSKSDVALSRDASQGISEYAPGAEVIANGRIWESAGLAFYPKAFMPERFYTACGECFHVDIGDAPDEISPACSNCGNTEGRRKRRFVEPQGFVTSYSQSKGRDPGGSRLRPKPADEAKLIAAPRDDVFISTELSFLRTALLRAKGGEGLPGALFIANRGGYGEGYYRCSRCNFSKAIEKAKSSPAAGSKAAGKMKLDSKIRHDDPMDGKSCPNEQLSRSGLDFVHRFQTDVRLFRFLPAMPAPDENHTSPRRFHERFARTVSEAVRLAATDLLHLYQGELRAIYRLYGSEGGRLEVVLYDGVPGGAGYCSRIGEPGFSVADLLKLAVQRLNCSSGCETGCRTCLCDYGNQRYWDTFERKAAYAWLSSLLEPSTQEAGPGRYVSWTSPSLAGLTERVANYSELNLVARTLVDSTTFSEECLSLFVSWMQAAKKLNVYLSSKLEDRPKSKSALTVYRRLHPYQLEGLLNLHVIPKAAGLDWADLPRVFTSTLSGGAVFRQHFAVEPLMQSIVAAPVDIGVVDAELETTLNHLVSASEACARDVLEEGAKLAIHELHKGVPRDFAALFQAVSSATVKKLTIYDPYCGALINQKRLEEFIKMFRRLVSSIDRFEIVCKETRDRDGDVEFYLDVERRVDYLLRDKGFENREVTVMPLKGTAKTFHDRQIDVLTVSCDGCDELHRYFLTGGLDFLMDDGAETKVFYIRISV
jgi:DEAD/DEAH box helicase/Helicase conserved C-terminal domain/Domain of unknown function (DUF1998)